MHNKNLSVTSIIVAACIALCMILLTIHQRSDWVQSVRTGSNVMKSIGGFGGGVVVTSQHGKQFVTMVQKRMFSVNTEGYIAMQNTTKRVWIDIGSNSDSFLGASEINNGKYWPQRSSRTLKEEFQQSNDLFVIAVDPNIVFYETLSKIPRLIPIIAAVFVEEGTKLFYEYKSDGCSSLLEPNLNLDERFSSFSWFKPCHEIKQMTGVAMIRLETILSLIDPRMDIELLKVDAQGVDLQVVQSAKKQIRRVQKIIIETQVEIKYNQTSNLLYKNSNTANETRMWMAQNEFALDQAMSTIENKAIAEYNYVFDNLNLAKKI